MPRRDDNTIGADMALVIDRQIRRAENKHFLRQLPGFELGRDLPARWLDLLRRLRESEAPRKDGAEPGKTRGAAQDQPARRNRT